MLRMKWTSPESDSLEGYMKRDSKQNEGSGTARPTTVHLHSKLAHRETFITQYWIESGSERANWMEIAFGSDWR